MDLERSRIKADLSGLLTGEVLCDEVTLQLYASDASIYQIQPLAVVRPVSTEDVAGCVKYARENHLPVHARGAGTSVCGAPLGPGIVIDFSAAMRRVLQRMEDRVRVQPGVVLAGLNRQLQTYGKLFGPDPALRSVTTMGGVLATNASGSHWLRYGSPRDKVISLQMVTADAEIVEFRRGQIPSAENAGARYHGAVAEILNRRRDLIAAQTPKTPVNRAGYQLNDLEPDGQLDLSRLIVGSEGTLGIITQAELALDSAPNHRGVVLFFFDRMESASNAALEVLAGEVATCDLMDRRLLSLAREDSRFARIIPANAEAMLLVECDSEFKDDLQAKLQRLIQRVERRKKLAFQSRFSTEIAERNLYWRLIRRVIPSLYRMRGSRQAVPFVDEIAVAPERLPELLTEAHAILNDFEVTASMFSHVGQGVVRLHPFLDLSRPTDRDKMQPLATRLYETVLRLGGTISGSHGDGLSRTWFLRQQYGRLYEVFKEIKRVFDPQNLFNPGKIIDEPHNLLVNHLRPTEISTQWTAPDQDAEPLQPPETAESLASKSEPAKVLKTITPMLHWQPSEISQAAIECNGCGRCRTTAPDQRMCPIFRLNPIEEASPRAKANLMCGLLSGQLPVESLSQDNLKEVADLCVNCHQCRIECPAAVDIPKLMVEAKAQYVSINGLKLSQLLLTRLDWLFWFGGRLPWLTNLVAQIEACDGCWIACSESRRDASYRVSPRPRLFVGQPGGG